MEILLKDEIATAESYLKIQSFRYRKRLEYTIDTDAVNDGYKVIPYILQPIVENSIIHGMEEQRQETHNCLKKRIFRMKSSFWRWPTMAWE